MSPRNDLDTSAKNSMFSCAGIRPIIPPLFFLFGPLPAPFVISTELSLLQIWIYFEKYVSNFILSVCLSN